MAKTIIFDFDGTLVDSLPVVIQIAQDTIDQDSVDLTIPEYEQLRNMSMREIIKYSGIPYYKIPALLVRGKKLLSERLHELKVFPGIPEMLKGLHDGGHTLCVVSSNSEANIRAVLQREGVEEYFAGVYGNVGLFTKSRVFKVVLRDQKVKAEDTMYVGDEVRDIEAAKKSHIRIVSVTWGYNGEQILSKYQPNFLAHTPAELAARLSSPA